MSEWISVEDKLPHIYSWVLVCSEGVMNCVGYGKVGFEDWTHASCHNIIVGSITHWMPLPELPK